MKYMKIVILIAALVVAAMPSMAQGLKYSVNGTYTGEGKKIYLINWIPDGNGGFELEKWNFADIEKLREETKRSNIENLAKMSEELLHPPIKIPDKPKPKPKKKPERQATLF